jgi:hypothetical protein
MLECVHGGIPSANTTSICDYSFASLTPSLSLRAYPDVPITALSKHDEMLSVACAKLKAVQGCEGSALDEASGRNGDTAKRVKTMHATRDTRLEHRLRPRTCWRRETVRVRQCRFGARSPSQPRKSGRHVSTQQKSMICMLLLCLGMPCRFRCRYNPVPFFRSKSDRPS